MRKSDELVSKRKLLEKAISRPRSLRFDEMVSLVEAFGFRLSRQRGSHHIFTYDAVRELVNLQEVKGRAKPYQIR